MKLTEHFSLEEMTRTKVGFRNQPDPIQRDRLRFLCERLEEVRINFHNLHRGYPEPLIINSGFRNELVNRAVGGSKTSNHMRGTACDIRCLDFNYGVRLYRVILDLYSANDYLFDELYLEITKSSVWVHFAIEQTNRRLKSGLFYNHLKIK